MELSCPGVALAVATFPPDGLLGQFWVAFTGGCWDLIPFVAMAWIMKIQFRGIQLYHKLIITILRNNWCFFFKTRNSLNFKVWIESNKNKLNNLNNLISILFDYFFPQGPNIKYPVSTNQCCLSSTPTAVR